MYNGDILWVVAVVLQAALMVVIPPQAMEYRNPDTYSINVYSALQLLAEGVKKAGSLDAAFQAQSGDWVQVCPTP